MPKDRSVFKVHADSKAGLVLKVRPVLRGRLEHKVQLVPKA